MKILMEQDILQENANQASENKKLFGKAFVVNIIGSPGCGKTTLLEKTLAAIGDQYKVGVIEGDIYTAKDAERIAVCGTPVIQVNTAGGCHLSAEIIAKSVDELKGAQDYDLIIIENVGNLVCPAEFDLGEDCKVAVLSTPEGEDKPAKYPLLFTEARAVIINKCDLLPYISFDMEAAKADISGLNQDAPIMTVTASTGEGLDTWIEWLEAGIRAKKA